MTIDGYKIFPMMNYQEALSLVRLVPDFPKPGILFQDITPVLGDGAALSAIVNELSLRAQNVDAVAGIEARGFILGAAIAHHLKIGFVPIRKSGKLPYDSFSRSYNLEYASDALEIHRDAVNPGSKVFLIDDILATGGTLLAAIELVEEVGGVVSDIGLLGAIEGLDGFALLSTKYPTINIHILGIE